MFKIGLVGTGIIAESHKDAILKTDELKITAVCDIDPQKAETAAEGTDANIYTDYREMAKKEDLDCVILNLPHFLHKEVSVYFLQKGISVLVEKPMANTVSECEEMIAAAKKSSAKFGIGHVQKYFDCYRILKDIIDSGKLGKLCSITETRNIHYFTEVRPKWFLNKKLAGGGIVMNYCAHTLDKIIYATGLEIEDVHAFGNNFVSDDDVEATCQVLLKLNGGVTAALTYCGAKVPTQYDTYFYFTEGTVAIKDGGSSMSVLRLGEEPVVYDFDTRDIFERQITELVKMLKGEENEIVTPETGKKIIAVNERIVNMI